MSSEPLTAQPAVDRLMVAVSPAPQAGALVQLAARMAAQMGVPWLVVSVEPASYDRSAEDARRVVDLLLLAERQGAETLVVRGDDVPTALLAVARARGVSRLIVGRPTHTPLRDRLHGSKLDKLLREATGIEVLVTSEREPQPSNPRPAGAVERAPRSEYLVTLLMLLAAPALGWMLEPALDVIDHAMIHLLAIVVIASRVSRGPALLATLGSVLSFDVFFVPPTFELWVADLRFLTTFLVMGIAGLVVSTLTVRVGEQAHVARRREQRTQSLYAITRALAAGGSRRAIAQATAEHSATLIGGRAEVSLIGSEALRVSSGVAPDPGARPDRLTLPIPGSGGSVGTLELDVTTTLDPEHRQLLDLFAAAAGAALERVRLADEAARAHLDVELERVRNGLLSAVSHDLRTPLASIVGGVGAVLEGSKLAPPDRVMLEATRDEANRLGGLLQGLLDLTRLSSGVLSPRLEWWPASELISGARARLSPTLRNRALRVEVRPPETEIYVDGLLVGQLLENLLDNAIKYSPSGSPVEIVVLGGPDRVRLEVRDHGPGVPEAEREHIFERFYRLDDGGRNPGAGIGLAICAAVVRVHGGSIRVEARPDGPGACFVVEMPSPGAPPKVLEVD